MKRLCTYLLLLLLLGSCAGGGKLIPKGKLSRIYAEMFLADQWIKQNNKGKVADTSLVYEPIFQKWGYSVEDYRRSVDKYQEDPDKFSEVFEQAAAILQARLDELGQQKKLSDRADSIKTAQSKLILRAIENYGELFSAHPERDFPVFSMDSTGVYVMEFHLPDTTFLGPRVISHLPGPEDGEEEEIADRSVQEAPAMAKHSPGLLRDLPLKEAEDLK